MQIIQVRFSDEQESKFFIKILNKIKDEKSESLSQLDKSSFYDCVEKGLISVESLS